MLTTSANIPPPSSICLMLGGRGYISSLLCIADISFMSAVTTKNHDSPFPLKIFLRHRANIWTSREIICYLYLYVFVCVCVWVYVYVYVYVYTYVCAYAHTYVHGFCDAQVRLLLSPAIGSKCISFLFKFTAVCQRTMKLKKQICKYVYRQSRGRINSSSGVKCRPIGVQLYQRTLAQVTKCTAWQNCIQSCWKHTTERMLFRMTKLRFY